MTEPRRDERVDQLRQQLRALGYLDAGVDRFLLAPAREQRSPAALAARSGLRVGILGGALLGPAAAVGLGTRLPGLVSGFRDAVVLAVYLGIFFGAAFAALSTGFSLLATVLAGPQRPGFTRRARALSTTMAATLAIACLAYLTFWWRSASAGFGWSAPILTTAALGLAVVISLLLGHAVRITTLAVIGAAAASQHLPAASKRSWRLVIAGGVLAFAGAAALLLWTAPADAASDPDHSPLTVVPTGSRVTLIAIDGFDRAIAEQLGREGRLPTLEWVFRGGRAVLVPEDTTDPAPVWTTVATGVPPAVHGVHAIETRRVAGVRGILSSGNGRLARMARAATDAFRLTRPSVASREERRAKTLWEVAADAGLRTAVVNWWATWPAPPRSGIVLTDRAVLRLERGGTLDGEIAPPEVYDGLRSAWPALRNRARAAAQAALGTAPGAVDALLRRSAELDATLIEMLRELPGPARDLDVLYLPGLDIAQHALLSAPDGGTLAPSLVTARVDALKRYYPFLDSALAPLLAPQQSHIVIVVVLPGRVQASAGGMVVTPPLLRDSAEGDVGIHLTRKALPAPASMLDIAPTIWHALGIPLSRELAGRALPDLFEVALNRPDRYVSTYGRPFRAQTTGAGKPLDQEMLDRLRSLGYVR